METRTPHQNVSAPLRPEAGGGAPGPAAAGEPAQQPGLPPGYDFLNDQPPAGPDPGARRRMRLVLVILAAIVLLLAAVLLWMVQARAADKAQRDAAHVQLERTLQQLNKNAAANKKTATGAGTGAANAAAGDDKKTAAATCTVAPELTGNIAAAVQSGNYAALAGYMTDPVQVVVAASEKGGSESPDAAVADMGYLAAAQTWDFNLTKGVTDVWAAHFYGQYFSAPFFAGRAASDEVVSFQFEQCDKISSVFMAVDYHLLETN